MTAAVSIAHLTSTEHPQEAIRTASPTTPVSQGTRSNPGTPFPENEVISRTTAKKDVCERWANRAATTSFSSIPSLPVNVTSSGSSSASSKRTKTTGAYLSALWRNIPRPFATTRRTKSMSSMVPSPSLSQVSSFNICTDGCFTPNVDDDSDGSSISPTGTPVPRSPLLRSPSLSLQNKRQLTNALTNLKITSHLQSHLNSIISNPSQIYLNSALSILPPGFDQTSACISSSKDRKRAFVLLDLTRVIWDHALFLSVTCGFGYNGRSCHVRDGQVGVGGAEEEVLPPTHYRIRRKQFFHRLNSIGINLIANKQGTSPQKVKDELYIQPQFRVMKNPNIELLKLLVRLGVDLRCSTSDDVIAASRAFVEERAERLGQHDVQHEMDDAVDCPVVVDDVTFACKPNSYYRRLLRADSSKCSRNALEVAVDGLEEVKRTSNTIRRITNSSCSLLHDHHGDEKMLSLEWSERYHFILRLPTFTNKITTGNYDGGKKHDTSSMSNLLEVMREETLQTLILDVHKAAIKEGAQLKGVSVDLSPWREALQKNAEEDCNKENCELLDTDSILMMLCAQMRLFRLIMLCVNNYHIRIDLTGLPNDSNFISLHVPALSCALRTAVSADVTYEELIRVRIHLATVHTSINGEKIFAHSLETVLEKANDPLFSSLFFTADVSDLLVSSAGALCSRIIGKRSNKQQPNLETASPDNGEKENEVEDVAPMHYYIDDGCYGSLYLCPSSNKQHKPEPLYGDKVIRRSQSFNSMKDRPTVEQLDTSNYINATVWGPTCDGIDKVCESVSLPSDLQANMDWLVFRNLGCGGLGGGFGLRSGFNGIDPPDIVYCALPSPTGSTFFGPITMTRTHSITGEKVEKAR